MANGKDFAHNIRFFPLLCNNAKHLHWEKHPNGPKGRRGWHLRSKPLEECEHTGRHWSFAKSHRTGATFAVTIHPRRYQSCQTLEVMIIFTFRRYVVDTPCGAYIFIVNVKSSTARSKISCGLESSEDKSLLAGKCRGRIFSGEEATLRVHRYLSVPCQSVELDMLAFFHYKKFVSEA